MVQYFTAEGIKKLKEELNHLKTVETRKIAELLKYAASFGDLKENAGYDDAKERQASLIKKISDLNGIVNDAIIYEKKETDGVQVGSVVTILLDGVEEKMEVVAPSESDILKNKISYLSPLGEKIMGKKKGREFVFEIGGEKSNVKIIEIK